MTCTFCTCNLGTWAGSIHVRGAPAPIMLTSPISIAVWCSRGAAGRVLMYLIIDSTPSYKRWMNLQYTGWAKSQFTYVGSYTNVVFYIRGLLLCRWHTVPTCSRIPSSKFENSNILDHAHSILKHLYCWL